ncbi:MAG: hypothetical protein QOG15_715 [Solirubrobacteraceae bacterium]|jgi:hypothetical protein|nr:hypothetical protein [Solirubrobacteraceae bacterium]
MTRAIVALAALALVLPAPAIAKAPQTNAPPGNSAIDEYLETVPGATGNTRPRPPGQKGGGGLTAAQRARLQRLGPDGTTLANAIDSTSSKPLSNKARSETAAPKSDGRSPLGEVLNAFTGSDGGSGMGAVLPAILIAALLAAVVAVLLRRRATS